jgi:hypothetical protein
MTNHFFPTVLQPSIPLADMTGAELLLLTRVFQSELDGDGLYFYAEQSIDDMPTIAVDEAHAALEDEDGGVAAVCIREHLARTADDDGYLQFDGDVPWEAVLQDIVRRSDTIPEVTLKMSFTCSKMLPHAFGGMVIVITAAGCRSKSTDDVACELLDELEHGAVGAAPGFGVHALVQLSEPSVRERVQGLAAGDLAVTDADVRSGCEAALAGLDFTAQRDLAAGVAARVAVALARQRHAGAELPRSGVAPEHPEAAPLERAAARSYLLDYPLRAFFDCSTAHLSPSTCDYLAGAAARAQTEPLTWTAETPFGWFVWVEEDPSGYVPDDLAAIMRHARAQGAEYILFDCDAPENAAFPVLRQALSVAAGGREGGGAPRDPPSGATPCSFPCRWSPSAGATAARPTASSASPSTPAATPSCACRAAARRAPSCCTTTTPAPIPWRSPPTA